MKVLIFPLLILIAIIAAFFNSKQKNKKNIRKTNVFIIIATFILIGLGLIGMYQASKASDTQCTKYHNTNSIPPNKLITAEDYFHQGDYDYETGSCTKAIGNYTKAIQLKPDYPEAYNNRAYTFMRMQNYSAALPDLKKAISLRPGYINALMNEGDIYNFYGPVIDKEKALRDYNTVIALGGGPETSVCGHKAIAQSNGFLPAAIFRALMNLNCR